MPLILMSLLSIQCT